MTNTLIILVDQQRRDALPAYGNKLTNTPAIDSIAHQGVTFDRAYTTSPACSPARASLHTGLFPCKHGMQTNIFQHGCMLHELADTPRLLSRCLQQAGCIPGFTGKWHLGYGSKTRDDPRFQQRWPDIDGHLNDVELPEQYREASSLPTDLGFVGDDFPGHGGGGHSYPSFQDWLRDHGRTFDVTPVGYGRGIVTSGSESTVDHFLADRAIHWLEHLSSQREPWCFLLNFWGPHEPAFVPEQFIDKWRGIDVLPWQSFERDLANCPPLQRVKREDHAWEEWAERIRFSLAYSEFIDFQIGRVLDAIKKIGCKDDTAVIYSADHGDSLGTHAGLGDKGFHLYEPTTAIPMIAAVPGGATDVRSDAPVSIVDVHATAIDLASGEQPGDTHGRSLEPILRSGKTPNNWRHESVCETSGLGHCLCTQRMIRIDRWKYIFTAGSDDELFDLDEDPAELRNLAQESSCVDVSQRLKHALHNWMIEHEDGLAPQFAKLAGISPAT